MRAKQVILSVAVLLLGAIDICGCDSSDNSGIPYDTSTGPDTDTDADTDTDGDTGTNGNNDSDSDDDTESDTDTGEIAASYIWIANSEEGSVSKIDTRKLVELGRYWVRSDHSGSPSRTSVNLNGDMVVAARTGGITKIYASVDDCVESNGVDGIQTSSGASEILEWDQEECRAWHTSFTYTSMRALAWTSDNKVWATGSTGTSESSVLEVVLLNGDTGVIEETISFDTNIVAAGSHGHGGYGGVVDADDNFWIVQVYSQKLIKVNYNDLTYEVFDEPAGTYGVTVDENGRIWTCNMHVAYFDPSSETWSSPTLISNDAPFYDLAGGCMSDGNGLIWISIYDTLYAVSIDDFSVVDTITNLPPPTDTATGTDSFWGVAVDVDGFVWTIPRYGDVAYKIDPETHYYETVTGLVGAYTYSDMTGFLLGLVNPPV